MKEFDFCKLLDEHRRLMFVLPDKTLFGTRSKANWKDILKNIRDLEHFEEFCCQEVADFLGWGFNAEDSN